MGLAFFCYYFGGFWGCCCPTLQAGVCRILIWELRKTALFVESSPLLKMPVKFKHIVNLRYLTFHV